MTVVRREIKDNKTGKTKRIWIVDVTITYPRSGKTVRKRLRPKRGNTKHAAEAFERQLWRDIEKGTCEYIPREERRFRTDYTIAEFSEVFMDTYVKNNCKHSVQITRTGIFKNHINPAMGQLRLNTLTPLDVENYKAHKLDEGFEKKTINNQLGVLRKMYNEAVEWEILPYAPKIKAFKKLPEPEFDFLDFSEADRIINAAHSVGDRTYHALILVALRTGLRIGELRALSWNDVDLVARRLVVRRNIVHRKMGTPKNGKSRELPLCDSVVTALKGIRHLKGEFVFSEPDGAILDHNAVYRRLQFICDKAGLRRIGYHILRHSFASHLAMKAVPLKAIMEFMGHSDIKMTMRYAHLSPSVNREYVNLLDKDWHFFGTFSGDKEDAEPLSGNVKNVPKLVTDRK